MSGQIKIFESFIKLLVQKSKLVIFGDTFTVLKGKKTSLGAFFAIFNNFLNETRAANSHRILTFSTWIWLKISRRFRKKIKFWHSDHFGSKISMDSCIGISISIKKQHFFRFLGMCHMCAGSFWRFRRALSSSEGSEFMFVHFQVKWFGLIRRTNSPAEVFIWGACSRFFNVVESDKGNRSTAGASYKDFRREICPSNQTEPFDLEVHKHKLWALWRAQSAAKAPKWSCTHVAHTQKSKKVLFFDTYWYPYAWMHTYFAFKMIRMPKFYFFRNLREILSQIHVLNVKIRCEFAALVSFKKLLKIAKNAPNGPVLPFNTVCQSTCTVSDSINFWQFFRKLKFLTRYMWFDIISETFSRALLTVSDSFGKNWPKTTPFREWILFFRFRFDNFSSKIATSVVDY